MIKIPENLAKIYNNTDFTMINNYQKNDNKYKEVLKVSIITLMLFLMRRCMVILENQNLNLALYLMMKTRSFNMVLNKRNRG